MHTFFCQGELSSTAKVARWFQQLPWHTASLSRPESGFVSGDSRSEKFHEDQQYFCAKDTDDLCDEFLLVEGSSTIWTKLSAKKRRKLLGMRLGKMQMKISVGIIENKFHILNKYCRHYLIVSKGKCSFITAPFAVMAYTYQPVHLLTEQASWDFGVL
uniref:Uncharacterized protein n=1 Tax=Glossina pallidipes TaxID=7398 RepID=A0A1A9ZKI7_GLOPL